MPAINLLPKDLTPKEGVVKVSDLIKKFVTIGFTALLISLLAFIGFYYYINEKIKEAQVRQEAIMIEISALEQTEVRLVLVKDRLQKSESILSIDTAKNEVLSLSSLLEILPSGSEISQTVLSQNETTVVIELDSSKTLSELLARLVSSGIYSTITITSLGYNQLTGYSIALRLTS